MKAYTDLPQSKKLEEFLPIESADMRYHTISQYNLYPCDEIVYTIDFGKPSDIDTPAWSLAALIDVLPEGVIENYYAPNLQKENGKYSIAYGDEELLCVADNPVDVCYEMILKLHEQKLL